MKYLLILFCLIKLVKSKCESTVFAMWNLSKICLLLYENVLRVLIDQERTPTLPTCNSSCYYQSYAHPKCALGLPGN